MAEVLKPIPGFEHYYASSDGHILSCAPQGRRPRLASGGTRHSRPLNKLSAYVNRDGKLKVGIVGKSKFVAELVCLAFLGERPEPTYGVRFLDNDPLNCRIENLQWVSRSELAILKLVGSDCTEVRSIPGFRDYWATSEGHLVSTKHMRARRLKGSFNGAGYLFVSLYLPGKRKGRTVYVHQAIALAFHGVLPEPGLQVRHLNGDPLDNRPDNLQYGNYQDQLSDKVRHGTCKLNPETVGRIRQLLMTGATHTALAAEFGISRRMIGNLADSVVWPSAGCTPEFLEWQKTRRSKVVAVQYPAIRSDQVGG